MTDNPCRVEGDTSYSDQLTSIYEAGLERLGNRFVQGQIPLDDLHQHMKDAIDKMAVFQSMAGVNGDRTQVNQDAVVKRIQGQYGYLDGFMSKIEAAMQDGDSLDFVPSQAAMYAGSSKASFWEAATNEADLPAQPCDGSSECLGNCGCEWKCINGQWYWVRDKNDSCPTCRRRAEEWAPYEGGE